MQPQKLQGLKLFDAYHQIAILCSLLFIVLLLVISTRLTRKEQNLVIKYLIVFTIGQEIADYLGRIDFNGLTFKRDLPLHLCHYGLYMGLYSLYKKNQFCFEFTFLIGIISALLAIFTPDMSDYNNWTNYITYFIHHSLIIIFPLWNIFIDKLTLRKFSIIYSFLFSVSEARLSNKFVSVTGCLRKRRPLGRSPPPRPHPPHHEFTQQITPTRFERFSWDRICV